MNYKKVNISLIIVNIFFLLYITNLGFNSNNSKDIIQNSSRSPVPIFYGLNESHSNSWAQIAPNGNIGLSYFQHNKQNIISGSLVYKTINPDGTEYLDTVKRGNRLEISTLLFNSNSEPQIFVAISNDTNQIIEHCFKNFNNKWENYSIINFENEGGKFIYELSVDIGPDGSYHLLVLKTRSNPDSYDFYGAFQNSFLYHITNASGSWQKELVKNFDMFHTIDEYTKMLNRQDIKIDKSGHAHVIYGEQMSSSISRSPSRLQYATNKSGKWIFETAIVSQENTMNSVGWYSSLALDINDQPNISCANIGRVPTGSAKFSHLLLLSRNSNNQWISETIAKNDDGYYGRDGRNYTGGLTHLVFDKNNTPNIIFTDIASSHSGSNYFNLGNIRYATKDTGNWEIRKIYGTPLPDGRYNATEIYDMCLLISPDNKKIEIIGQELKIIDKENYSCELICLSENIPTRIENHQKFEKEFSLHQNYPNPFNPITTISYVIPNQAPDLILKNIVIKIYDILGTEVRTLVNKQQTPGSYKISFNASNLSSGIYFYKISVGQYSQSKKMILIK